jgi:hypothetical protein
MTCKILAAILLLALPAASAEPPLPQLRIEPTAGGSIFYVKNVSSTPLTGLLIELVDYPGSSFALSQDLLGEDAIAPAKEKRIQVGNMTVGAVPDYVKVQVAVYADGATAGVPDKVAQFIERRRYTLETVSQLIRRLENAQKANATKEVTIDNLKLAIEFLQPHGKGTPTSQVEINRAVSLNLFMDVLAKLRKQSIDETLTSLRASEGALKASKPRL